MQKIDTARWLGGTGLVLLTAASFAGGLHLRPSQSRGHDLVRAQSVAMAPPAAGGLTFTGMASKPRVAQAAPKDAVTFPNVGADLNGLSFDSDGTPAAVFSDVYDKLRSSYVEGIPGDTVMSHGAVSAMLASLQDPATRFLEADEFAEARRESHGQFAGIGAALDIRTTITPKPADDPTRDKDHPANTVYALTVVSALPGGPADKAGLRTGDVITDIDGHWVATYDLVSAQAKELKAAQDKNDPVALNKLVQALQKKLDNGLTLPQAQDKLHDPKATKPLKLTVARLSTASPLTLTVLTITVTPAADTEVPPLAARSLGDGNAYVRMSLLSAQSVATLDSALTSLGVPVKGLVLDLRGATGGTPEDAAAVASKLTTATTLGLRLGKSLTPSAIPISPARAVTGPVVVLIDGGTDGASELLASALKAGGAKLIGGTTFGDDKDVRMISLPDGSGFTMTVGRLLTAAGGEYGGTGVAPDIAVTDSVGGDEAYQRALTELSGRVAHR